jgi:hypothetical protein
MMLYGRNFEKCWAVHNMTSEALVFSGKLPVQFFGRAPDGGAVFLA